MAAYPHPPGRPRERPRCRRGGRCSTPATGWLTTARATSWGGGDGRCRMNECMGRMGGVLRMNPRCVAVVRVWSAGCMHMRMEGPKLPCMHSPCTCTLPMQPCTPLYALHTKGAGVRLRHGWLRRQRLQPALRNGLPQPVQRARQLPPRLLPLRPRVVGYGLRPCGNQRRGGNAAGAAACVVGRDGG